MLEERMRKVTIVAAAASLLATAYTANAAPIALYEFGTSGDNTDLNDYSSSDGDSNSYAADLIRGAQYGTATTGWPNPTSTTNYNTTANDWRLYRKNHVSYVEPGGDDGNYLNDYQRVHTAGTNYLQWTVTPNANYELDLNSFTMDVNLGNTGFRFYYYLSSSLSNDSYATAIGSAGGVTASSGTASVSLTGAQFQNLTTPVTFRLWTWSNATGGSSGSGWQLDGATINGESVQVPEPATAMAMAGVAAMGLLRRRRSR